MQLQLKNARSVRISITFIFLAHMYYAAVLNCAFFSPKIQCYASLLIRTQL